MNVLDETFRNFISAVIRLDYYDYIDEISKPVWNTVIPYINKHYRASVRKIILKSNLSNSVGENIS